MNCIHCQGTMKRGKAPIHIDRDGCHITIDNVPAWICEQCGEPLFEEQEVEAIQDIVKAVDERCRLRQSAWVAANLKATGRNRQLRTGNSTSTGYRLQTTDNRLCTADERRSCHCERSAAI